MALKSRNQNFAFNFQGFVSCAWGVDKVGYVIVTFGICDSACSYALGFLIKMIGRVPIFVTGTVYTLGQ